MARRAAREPSLRAALVLGALLLTATPALASVTSDCHARLVAAYEAGEMPADLAALCAPEAARDGNWLAEIALGDEVDIARYWDLLRLTADLDAASAPPALDHAVLPGLLAAVAAAAAPVPGWWERLRAWLGSVLGERAETDSAWLEAWLARIALPPWLSALLVRVAIVLILVAALYVILRETATLSHGRVRRGRGRRADSLAQASDAVVVTTPSWDTVRALPPAQRPAALLMWLVSVLTARRLLPVDASLTNREQQRRLLALQPALAADFAIIIDTSEPFIFGARQAGAAALAELERRVADLGHSAASA